jgi:hypothetical protein
MSYCNVGDGGYSFAYSDSQNMPPESPGPSTATLESTSTLCMDGTVGEVVNMDFSDDWGCGLGVNLNQAMGTATPENTYPMAGAGVTVESSPLPSCTTARVIVDEGGVDYCAPFMPGIEIPWASFNTECWTNAGTFLSGPPTSKALKVEFVASTTAACPFTGFCITGISL